ncbi:MAG TPA: shikimate kinase [Gemmatimonadales bacterium]|nr:shikimate kinase [Gemmatimonadales bacterium]
MRRHIVIIGLPGAGKTTVGRLVAERLGAGFLDLDALIVRRMQMPVARVFAEYGEPRFRQLEAEAMRKAITGPPAVIAPGGGWAAQPGAIESVQGLAFLVYLRAMALTAARRASGEGTRPLLVGEDPVELMRQLLKDREPYYLRAECEVKADVKPPQALAEEVVALAQEHAGW